MKIDIDVSEYAGWTIAAIMACLAIIAIALASHGCQTNTSVTCADGTSYTQQDVVTSTSLEADEAEDFCEHHGGLK